MRVLIVDDKQDIADSLATLLGQSGWDVATASDGESALSLGARFAPDIVVLDIGLPDLSGYQVAEILRDSGSSRHLHIIAFTSLPEQATDQDALHRYFDCYFQKPSALDELLAHLDALSQQSLPDNGVIPSCFESSLSHARRAT